MLIINVITMKQIKKSTPKISGFFSYVNSIHLNSVYWLNTDRNTPTLNKNRDNKKSRDSCLDKKKYFHPDVVFIAIAFSRGFSDLRSSSSI